MNLFQLIILICIGLASGILAGALGVGGAIIVIPALVLILGLSQHEAQGTSLAFMVPPIGILAAWNYYKEGYVNWKFAAILAVTFFIGAYFGSMLSVKVPEKILQKAFGILLLITSVRMIFFK